MKPSKRPSTTEPWVNVPFSPETQHRMRMSRGRQKKKIFVKKVTSSSFFLSLSPYFACHHVSLSLPVSPICVNTVLPLLCLCGLYGLYEEVMLLRSYLSGSTWSYSSYCCIHTLFLYFIIYVYFCLNTRIVIWSILYTWHLLHIWLSWERDLSSVALPWVSSFFSKF